MANPHNLSIVLPTKNEATALRELLPKLTAAYPDAEIIVVDDGSTDDTGQIAATAGARVVRHRYNMGNGAAVKSGARAARGDIIVFMDADGQHDPQDIPRLLEQIDAGYDMVIGARSAESQASLGRRIANGIYKRFSSYVVGHTIPDLTSGFRAVRRERFLEFLFMLPNGFSYPTTITMAFFRSGYPVQYIPITAGKRTGKSHIQPMRDGLRFLLIIFRVGTLYSPLKLFFPLSFLMFALGMGLYLYTYFSAARLTNMSILLFMTAVIIFLIGLISEQITTLLFSRASRPGANTG